MAHLILKHDVSYCELDGHLYFLDVSRDRYLGGSTSLTSAVNCLLRGSELSEASRKQLIDTRLFVDAVGGEKVLEPPCQLRSTHAIYGRPFRTFSVYRSVCLLLSAILCLAVFHFLIGRTRLSTAIRLSQNSLGAKSSDVLPPNIESMLHSFAQAVRLFPRKDKCLPDALALRAYLGMQGIRTTLVFGIQPTPFMAHCWIQHHDAVLGQDLETVSAFHAIKAVS